MSGTEFRQTKSNKLLFRRELLIRCKVSKIRIAISFQKWNVLHYYKSICKSNPNIAENLVSASNLVGAIFSQQLITFVDRTNGHHYNIASEREGVYPTRKSAVCYLIVIWRVDQRSEISFDDVFPIHD